MKMKPWQINSLLILGYVGIVYLMPKEYKQIVGYVITIPSAIWVFFDAKKLDIKKYKASNIGTASPFWVAFFVAFFWILAMPIYISWRQKIINGKCPLKEEIVASSQKKSKKSWTSFFITLLAVIVVVVSVIFYINYYYSK